MFCLRNKKKRFSITLLFSGDLLCAFFSSKFLCNLSKTEDPIQLASPEAISAYYVENGIFLSLKKYRYSNTFFLNER